ncbi:MAG: hypothetical protein ACI30I_04190 [Parabacteroides sp.]
MRTQTEKARDDRNRRLCSDYQDMTGKEECAPHRIFVALAKKYNITIPCVRNIVIREGLYKPKGGVS